MFLVISEPQATLPDFSKGFFLKKTSSQFSPPNNADRGSPALGVNRAFAILVLFVWGFQSPLHPTPPLCKQMQLGTVCSERCAERKLAVLLL